MKILEIAQRRLGKFIFSGNAYTHLRRGLNIADYSSETYAKAHVPTEPPQITDQVQFPGQPGSAPSDNRKYTITLGKLVK